MEATADLHCAFCRKNMKQVKKLIAGPDVYICTTCIITCYDLLVKSDLTVEERTQVEEVEVEEQGDEPVVNPRAIREFLDKYVIGQDEAKMVVSVAAYNHYKRITNPIVDDVEIEKSNIMLLGPTGSGKTLIAQSLARLLEVPCVICDATALTEAGYVGEDVESLVGRLYAASKNDVAATERGIIFIDEIDKKKSQKSSSQSRDISGDGVQQALLRILEGTDVTVNRKSNGDGIKISTRNILFIVSGAFVGLDKIISKKKASIGFGSKQIIEEDVADVRPDHLIEFGMIPELVGRLPVIAALKPLNEHQLLQVLTEPRNAVTKQFKAMFSLEGVELNFSEEALLKVARKAITDKTGARGLRSVIEKDLMKIQYDLPDMAEDGLTKVTIAPDNVIFEYEKKDQENEA